MKPNMPRNFETGRGFRCARAMKVELADRLSTRSLDLHLLNLISWLSRPILSDSHPLTVYSKPFPGPSFLYHEANVRVSELHQQSDPNRKVCTNRTVSETISFRNLIRMESKMAAMVTMVKKRQSLRAAVKARQTPTIVSRTSLLPSKSIAKQEVRVQLSGSLNFLVSREKGGHQVTIYSRTQFLG